MPYYPPPSGGSSSVVGYTYYDVESSVTLDVPIDFENLCTNTMVVDGILQITGKVTVL